MRIRTIKPEWLDDELMVLASPAARVMSIGLILLADDYGRGVGNSALLASRIFPGHSRESREALAELVSMGFVVLYEVRGQTFFAIRNWDKHQRVDKPGKPRVPPPSEASENIREDSAKVRGSLATDHDLDHDHEQDPDHIPSVSRAARGGVLAETERLVEYFNRRCREANVGRRANAPTHDKRVRRLLKAGYSERQARLVIFWALNGPEKWAESETLSKHLQLETLLKTTSSNGTRTFGDYLERAEEWVVEKWGQDRLDAMYAEVEQAKEAISA